MRFTHKVIFSTLLFTLFFLIPAASNKAEAAVKTWKGGTGSNMTTAANWVGNVAPIANDDLVFPSNALHPTLINNYPAGTTFHSLTFQEYALKDPEASFHLSGNAMNLTNGITSVGGNYIELPLTLTQAQTIKSTWGSVNNIYYKNLNIYGNLILNANVTIQSDFGSIHMWNITSGAGGIILETGELDLGGSFNPNTFAGKVVIKPGASLDMSNPNVLGNTTGVTELYTGGKLRVRGAINAETINVLSGSGTTAFIQSDLLFGGTTFAAQINIPVGLKVEYYDESSFSSPTVFNGSFSGGGILEINSAGLAGNFNFNSSINLQKVVFTKSQDSFDANVLFNTQITTPFEVNTAARTSKGNNLSFYGSFGASSLKFLDSYYTYVLSGGAKGSPGKLTFPNGLQLKPGVTYRTELNGLTVVTQYDQISAGSSVNLGNAKLDIKVAAGFNPALGTKFRILDNTSTGAITGTFLNTPEGTVVKVGEIYFHVSYKGGTGNDVVLTVTDKVPLYRFWSDVYKGHFYTTYEWEKQNVINTNPNWKYEGIAFYVHPEDECTGKSPVYRFWSDTYRRHFYTINESEKNAVINNFDDSVWKYERVAFCSSQTQIPNSSAVYRFWSDDYKSHFYTIYPWEKDDILAKYPTYVWKYEQVAFFAYTKESMTN